MCNNKALLKDLTDSARLNLIPPGYAADRPNRRGKLSMLPENVDERKATQPSASCSTGQIKVRNHKWSAYSRVNKFPQEE